MVEDSVERISRVKGADGTHVEVRSVQAVSVVIECDGHDYHAANRQQVERDRARDRTLQALGYLVFRFPGSEINRNPYTAAGEAFAALEEGLGPRRDAA